MGWKQWLGLKRRPSRPISREVDALLLEGNVIVAAVGESHYQEALRECCGSERWEDVRFDCVAALLREPDNQYDPNAVAVYVEGGTKVGHLSRGDALDWQLVMEILADNDRVLACNAKICGRGPGSDTKNLGIFLHLPDVEDALKGDLRAVRRQRLASRTLAALRRRRSGRGRLGPEAPSLERLATA